LSSFFFLFYLFHGHQFDYFPRLLPLSYIDSSLTKCYIAFF
jgi:hypothetical protein